MSITKKVAAAIAVGGLALTTAACSSKSDDAAATGGDKNAAPASEITAYFYQSQAKIEPIVKAFEAENPGIKVTGTYLAGNGGDYAKTLQTRIAGKQAPDVFNIVGENRAEVMANHLAADISDLAVIKTVDPSWLDAYREGDKVYGMSYSAWMGGIIYNKDLFAKAGITTFPATWDEFIKAGEMLLAKGIKPYYEDQTIASGSLTSLLASSYKASGSPSADWVFDARPKGKSFADAWTPVITEWEKAIKAGVLPKETIGLDGAGMESAFVNGQVAMYRSGTWAEKTLTDAKINFGFAPFPAFPGGETFINGGPDVPYSISASASDAKKAAARKFIEFLGSAKGVEMQAKNQGANSISSAYASTPSEAFKAAYEDNLQKGRKYWFEWTKGSAPMTTAIVSQQQKIFQGATTPAEFAATLDKEFAKAS